MRGRIGRFVDRSLGVLRATLDGNPAGDFARAPLCDAPLASPDEYRRRWAEARTRTFPVIDRYEETSGVAIDAEWFHHLALLTQVTIKDSDVCYQHGRLLYATLAQYIRRRRRDHLTIVETGTARGFSALCMAKAMDDAGASGKIVSFDVLPHDAEILWNCLLDVEGPRTRAKLLQDYSDLLQRYLVFHRGDTKREMAKVSFPRIHFAFLDSVHQYDHVMAEFASIRGRQAAGDILFFDDYTPETYPGVVQAADEICRAHGYAATVVVATAQRRYLIAEKR